MMKRIIIIAIAALFSFGQGAWAQDPIEGLTYNDEGDYYEISSAADLNELAKYVNGDEDNEGNNCEGITFKVTKDITFGTNDSFEPIGWGEEDDGAAFSGIFDGQGFTISGIKFDDKNAAGVGLFGYIHYPAYIHDVKLENCEFTGNFHVGAIAGCCAGSNNKENLWGIYNCTVGKEVQVTAKKTTFEEDVFPGLFAGGIIGECINMTVKDCFSEAIVTGDDYFGCIAGRLMGGIYDDKKLGVIDNCYYSGNTYVQGSGAYDVAIGVRGPLEEFEGEGSEYTQGLIHITLLDDDREATIHNNMRIHNYEGAMVNVTLEGRTLFKDGDWNTICLPFDIANFTGTPIKDATVKKFSGSSFGENSSVEETGAEQTGGEQTGDENANTLELNFTDATSIEAGVPYMVKWEKSTNVSDPVFENVEIKKAEETESATTQESSVDFVGSFSPVTLTANDRSVLYMGAKNNLFYPNTDVTIGSFRAYFKLNGITVGDPAPATDPTPEEPNSINNFVLNFGDDMTGISLINHRTSVTSDSWFTLDGRKLSGQPTAKGIYINHGHKVIIK